MKSEDSFWVTVVIELSFNHIILHICICVKVMEYDDISVELNWRYNLSHLHECIFQNNLSDINRKISIICNSVFFSSGVLSKLSFAFYLGTRWGYFESQWVQSQSLISDRNLQPQLFVSNARSWSNDPRSDSMPRRFFQIFQTLIT